MANLVAKCDAYVITCDGTAVGDLLVWDRGGGAYFLGCICVIPEQRGRGVGSRGMRFLEERYPNALHWSLETPSDKEENHRFYQKHGFAVTRERMDGGVKVVLFEKTL